MRNKKKSQEAAAIFQEFRFQNNHGRTRTDTDELTNNSDYFRFHSSLLYL
jgi:hypothetical protein